jgi:hypothetical protein
MAKPRRDDALPFPAALREHFRRDRGAHPGPYVYARGGVTLALAARLPLRSGRGGPSALEAYHLLALTMKSIPPQFFPFAVDADGNLFVVDCATEHAAVHVWWHRVGASHLKNLRVGLAEFWEHVTAVADRGATTQPDARLN